MRMGVSHFVGSRIHEPLRTGVQIRSRLVDREGYGSQWMGRTLVPRYACARRSCVREAFRMERLVDEEIENDMGELIYMEDSNQLGSQYHHHVL